MNTKHILGIAAFACFSIGSAAQAQTAGNLIGAPISATGSAINGLGASHAGIAPTVNQVSPTLEPATDGVTNTLTAVGTGVQGTGDQAQANGVLVGTGADGQPLVSVGSTQPSRQGSVAAILNGHR